MNGVYKISLGNQHGLLIKNGNLYSWGFNSAGQLGLGDPGITFQGNPKLVSSSGNWTDIAAGTNHSLGICGGSLYSWGDGAYGELGLTYCSDAIAFYNLAPYGRSNNIIQYTPQKVGGYSNWTQVAAGNRISMGIRGGYLYGWGNNEPLRRRQTVEEPNYFSSPLGINFENGFFINDLAYQCLYVIVPIPLSTSNGWTKISTSPQVNFSLGIQNGNLKSWGNTIRGQLGDGRNDLEAPVDLSVYISGLTGYVENPDSLLAKLVPATHTNMPANNTWTDVDAGRWHSLGVSGGDLYAWGYNAEGALGDGTTFDRYTPTLINSSTDYDWKMVFAGENFSAGLIEYPGIDSYFPFSWGTNYNGQLGNGTRTGSLSPQSIGIESFEHMDISNSSAAAVESSSGSYKLYTWGYNTFSIPSVNNINIIDPNQHIPETYKIPNTQVRKISAGWGDVWILNNQGKLDKINLNGSKSDPSTLLEFNYTTVDLGFKVFSRITDLAAGLGTLIVSKEDNTISIDARGYNQEILVPAPYDAQIPELSNMTQRAWSKITNREPINGVFCGVNNYGIIFSDGTVETWGKYKLWSNYTPIKIKWKQIVSGGNHIVILTQSNRVFCFGDNSLGQCNVPSDLTTDIKSIFATPTASGAVKNNGDIVYWGSYDDYNNLNQLDLFKYLRSNEEKSKITNILPLNRKYKHNLIGYTFDGAWGESLYKNSIKTKLENYYNQLGVYPNKLVLNIQDDINDTLRWFNEPANIKYLGFTLNAAGISSANDGATYQNIWSNNNYTAPTRYEDFVKVLGIVTDFYSLGYTLAKQAIQETTGNRDSVAVGFNTGQLLPNYTLLGFSAENSGYTLNYKLSWTTGNTLLNYKEYSDDSSWAPYTIQGPDSYLPLSGFDITDTTYKPYSGFTASKNYYVNSIGITSAVYNTYYQRWKEFLNNVDFDFVIDTNISKFILPGEIENTPVIWAKTKQILKDYETENVVKLNKNILTSFAHTLDQNIGNTFDAVDQGPVMVQGTTGVYINVQPFINSINSSKSETYSYNTSINDLDVFDNSILAISGNTFQQKALNQWYYYGVYGGTYAWQNRFNDTGFTAIDWSGIQTELVNETYSVFGGSKPNVSKLSSLFAYFNTLNSSVSEQFNFYDFKNISKIKSGRDHSVLLNKFGNIYFLGSTLDNRRNIPQGNYIDVSAGALHSTAIDTAGKLFTAGKIITDSGGCTGSTLSVNLTSISGVFDTVESGDNHLALFETGENKKYLGRVDKVDDVFKRIYIKSYSAPDESPIQLTDPSGTNVSIIRDGSIIKNIQHKLLSIDSYMNSVQYIVDGAGNIQDPAANSGSVWKTTFINSYQTASGNDLLITPYKLQQSEVKITDIKYLNNNKLYEFEKQFKNLVQTENKIDIRISDL